MADSIREGLAKLDFVPEVILTSFHGVPKSYLLKGDPYHCQCLKTGRLIREAMGYTPEQMRVTFQSRFGNEEWLKPYTDETVQALAKSGVKRMAIVAPASPRIAWRRWRNSTARTATISRRTAARTTPSSPASTTRISACG